MNTESKEVAAKLSDELTTILQPEIEKVLPPQIGTDRFMRVVLTAISMNPDLRTADRRSLFTAAVKAATDGLVPDGREGAFVVFKSKDKDTEGREVWIQKVQWMPMMAGILKKVRNSGELLSVSTNVVKKNDLFRYWIDDAGEHITHEPNILAEDRGETVAAYAIAKTKDGGVYTEVMSRGQIEQVRSISKTKDTGPWSGPFYDEMARKSVFRRLSKRLPMSTDLEAVVRRDDEIYDLEQPVETAKSGTQAARKALGMLVQQPEPAAESKQPTAIPQYDEATALKAIKGCKTLDGLAELRKQIFADFTDTGREIPIAVEAAANDRREALS